MFYNFNIQKWVISQLPMVLRKPFFMSFIKALVHPLQFLLNTFEEIRTKTREQVLHAGAFKGSLDSYLNKLLGLDNEIYITDFRNEEDVFVYKEDELAERVYITDNKEQGLLYLSAYTPNSLLGGFIVHIPLRLYEDKAKLEKLINYIEYYKISGTKYKIKTY